ncbi:MULTISPECIES: HAMP domain-containing sensor histidine kinase [Catenuloplanes]|uniref:Signal transduction histidine-protein kinase/phosphatase MprB n=1 Tax=Catenuloplanes niger TaxID=587534 RepID=A0AAE3ZU92_9ACTN|nr:HAMP domain-containing sensor histidine kinase [Catenuloplanes niger]MDR7324875.1 signal transduction histidine kinase [Catenuloplanes niger]
MRAALARLALAVTSMVALSFVVPLALVVMEIAEDRALADARQQAVGMVAALTVTDDPDVLTRAMAATAAGADNRLAVHLPGAPPMGTSVADAGDVELVESRRQATTAVVPGGQVYLQATAIDGNRTAVIEVFVPDADLRRGVDVAWAAMAGMSLVLVAGSVFVADRIGVRLVRAARSLAGAARAFGAKDLSVRVTPAGPPELREAATAFNTMADRMIRFIDKERELASDLSHRLHTPLTALRLDADRIPPGPVADRVRQAVSDLQHEIDEIISGARRPVTERTDAQTDLVEVLADRLSFWAVLADDHGRPWQVVGADRPVWVSVPEEDLIGVVDALIGNVFEHTPQGTPFLVTVSDDALTVSDAGPGIRDPRAALQRGHSGGGSTGLGLSIVHRVATELGGGVHIDRGQLGGARVTLHLKPADAHALS